MTEKRLSKIAAQFEPTLHGATLVSEMRKPFDVLAEGLVSKNSRGDKTPLELFLAGIRGWEAGHRSWLDDGRFTC
jgi:hypothetical protein